MIRLPWHSARSFWTWVMLILSLYAAIGLWLLPFSPLPWLDEVIMASIAEAHWLEKSYLMTISATVLGQKQAYYGPVFFTLCDWSFFLFGFGIRQYRAVALFSGMVVILMANLIFGIYQQNLKWRFAFFTLLTIDPFLLKCLYEGRMDLTAVCLILVGVYYFMIAHQAFIDDDSDIRLSIWLWSGAAYGLALLTSLRGIFMMIPFGFGFLWILFTNWRMALKAVVVWAGAAIGLYLLWLLTLYKEWNQYFEVLLEMTTYANPYFWTFTIPKHLMLLITISIFFLIYDLFYKKIILNFTSLFSIISIISFYLIIHDFGYYSSYILVFYYAVIFQITSFYYLSNNKTNQ